MSEEQFPVHETVKVIKGKTMFKNAKWWEAVLLVSTSYNDKTYRKVVWYRWQWKTVKPRTGVSFQKWTRKEHKNINFKKNWDDAKEVIEEFMREI